MQDGKFLKMKLLYVIHGAFILFGHKILCVYKHRAWRLLDFLDKVRYFWSIKARNFNLVWSYKIHSSFLIFPDKSAILASFRILAFKGIGCTPDAIRRIIFLFLGCPSTICVFFSYFFFLLHFLTEIYFLAFLCRKCIQKYSSFINVCK